MPEHARLTGVKHPRSVDAPSHTRRRSSLFLSQGADLAMFCVGNHSLDTSALQHHYQSAARILPATRMCGSRQRRPRQPISPIPGRPQGGSPPSLRPRTSLRHRPVPSTTPTAANPHSIASAGPSRSGTTSAPDAATRCVAVPELPIVVPAPALDAPVVLRSAASLMHPEDGAGCLLGGFLKAPGWFPQGPASFH